MKQKPIIHLEKDGKRYLLVSSDKANDLMTLENVATGMQFESKISKAVGYRIERQDLPDLPDPPQKGLGRNESRARLNTIKRKLEPFLDDLKAVGDDVKTLSAGDYKKYLLAVQRLENFLTIKE